MTRSRLVQVLLLAAGLVLLVCYYVNLVPEHFFLIAAGLLILGLLLLGVELKPGYSRLWLCLGIVLLSGVLIYYFVENPGGTIAARLLNYKVMFRAYREHILLTVIGSVAAIIVSVFLGIVITRPLFRPIAPVVDSVVNIGQTIPSLAILALFFVYLGRGFNTAVFALWLYALLPILRNTSAGIQSITYDIIEAARGMGMSNLHILTRIELPLALPVIMAGIRTSVVVTVGAATLATFIGAGGLGDIIVTGLSVSRMPLIVAGASLSALLAIFMDQVLAGVENYLRDH